MSKIIRCLRRNSSQSSSSSVSNRNKELILNETIDYDLCNWKLPKSKPNEIYKSNFSFKSDYIIETVEESMPISQGYSTFQLLSTKRIKQHQQKYNFLHLGMIQVALKPATRLGLNTSVLVCLHDKRNLKFHDSLIGVIESSLCDGPIYFSCFPNFTLSLNDPHLMRALSLDIKSEGYDMLPGLKNVILIYRFHYKVMSTFVSHIRQIQNLNDKRKTTLFITNMAKSNKIISKTISWEEVKFPEQWILEQANEPVKQENEKLEEIIEHPNGDVELRFSKERIIRLKDNSSHRFSTSSVPSSSSSGVS
ncbi:uncharacterized protein LOC112526483 [Cynara cardunculus var. scolymus]|uniref:uncharacterized protein LOC112526483 n=1 Tax=Cynara cardunculus var. scolymus TaxID=59895 RepID=UPI000D62E9DB|nr:uncharacterized protein LOC112526483 [Cynara cardunculus var. scolymus]